MPKLKGLLDSANAKLAGLLGDFPQGFNAGAVAGFPGWAGDMAYLADTARLALTGADSQAAPEDYVGTTDYIAKQAGYPVPQTLSGQLGAAVGGLMSPGPGDLAKFAPLGAMFLGAKAKTAMPDVLEYAQAMEKAGKSADEIWQTTGKLGQPWFKGADGKWRFEIPDNEAALTSTAQDVFRPVLVDMDKRFDASLPDFMNHPELMRQYDFLRNVGVKGIDEPSGGSFMQVPSPLATDGQARVVKVAKGASDPLSTGLHETQHAIQRAEGFARGGSPDDIAVQRDQLRARIHYLNQEMGEAARGMDRTPKNSPEYEAYRVQYDSALAEKMDMDPSLVQGDPYESYRRLAGEAEARNVQSRMNLTMDERLALPPWATQDVPTEQQIVRFGDGPAMAIEDFAARRAGKAKPYREAVGADTMPAMSKPQETPDYGINHRPPMRSSGAPLYDATGGGNVYPDDVYSAKAQQYYGTGDAKLDRDTFRLLNAYKNEPDAPVTIYRAVPSDVDATDINPGDWVTINKAYADMHGEGFENGYKVIKKQVKARDIFTNGDSIHEWGYDPDGM